jgi:hypothetical protein
MMHKVKVIYLATLFVLCNTAVSYTQEREAHHWSCGELHAPDVHYYTGVRDHNAARPPVLTVQLSITSAQAESEASLVRLGCQLAADFPNEVAIEALIFDDKVSARSLALYAQDQTKHWTYLWHLRARYELNRSEKRQVVEFLVPDVEDGILAVKKYRALIDF